MYLIICILVSFVSIIHADNNNYNLILVNSVTNSIEEYSGDTFSLLRNYANDKLDGIYDVEVMNGYLFVSSYHMKAIQVYNETTLEFIQTLRTFNDNPARMSWVNDGTTTRLAVNLDFLYRVFLFDIDFNNGTVTATDYLSIFQTSGFMDLTQRDDTRDLITVSRSPAAVQQWSVDGNTSSTVLPSGYFGDLTPRTLLWHNDHLWVAAYQGANSTLFKFQMNGATATLVNQSVPIPVSIRSFLFPPDDNDTILILGVINDDARFLSYSISTQQYTEYINSEKDGNYLGSPQGAIWAPDGSILVADGPRVQQYLNGAFVRELSENGGLVSPTGVSSRQEDPNTLYITSMNKVLLYNRLDFKFIGEFLESADSDLDGAQNLNRISVTSDNATYLAATYKTYLARDNAVEIEYNAAANDVAIDPNSGQAWTSLVGTMFQLNEDGTLDDYTLFLSDFSTIFDFLDENTMVIADYSETGFLVWDFVAHEVIGVYTDETLILDIAVGPDGNIYLATVEAVVRYNSSFEGREVLLEGDFDAITLHFAKAVCPPCSEGDVCVYGSCMQDISSQKKSNNTLIAIAVGVGGGALLLVGAALAVLFFRRRQSTKSQESMDENISMEKEGQKQTELHTTRISTDKVADLDSHWEIDFLELELGAEIGAGAFGTVYKAMYRNSDCVVKQLTKNTSKEAVANFLKEAQAVKRIRPHKNVCSIFGVCTNEIHPTCIVMEYVNGGSLQEAIICEKLDLDTRNLLKIMEDIVSGMAHVHAEGLLHCDLACRNLLVSLEKDNEFTIKVADFGLARFSEYGVYNASITSVFPIRWSAPEVLRGSRLSKASDVWAFGIVMWEILESKLPYVPMSNEDVVDYVCSKKILPAPKRIPYPAQLYDIMQTCWAFEAARRPTFKDLLNTVKQLQAELLEDREEEQEDLPNSNDEKTRAYTVTSYQSMKGYQPNAE